MAKMTLAQLKTNVKSYIDTATQGGAWTKTTNNFIGLIDKIGKVVTIDGGFNDKLPMMDGDELPFGKTVEEYFIDLTLPSVYSTIDAEGAKDVEPALPSVEQCVYSTTLGRKKIKTTVPYDNFERACTNAEDASNITAQIYGRLNDSYEMYKYQIKKQMIGKVGDLCVAGATQSAGLVEAVAIPTDTETAEAFVQAIKESVEDASFANEGHCLSGALVGSAQNMVLYVKKGVMPTVQVKALAGAFQKEELAIPAKVVVVDDFGVQTNDGVYAVLADERAMKLHRGYKATRTAPNADGDFVNIVDHSEHTAFISKYAYVKAFKDA